MEEEKNKLQTFRADGWTGESKVFTNVVKKWVRTLSPLPSQEQQEQEQVSWMARVEEREGDKGARGLLSRLEPPTGTKGVSLVPVGASNRDKRPLAPLSPSLSTARAIQLICSCSCCSWLGRGERVLTHFFTTFVKIFDSPVHPSALKVWSLFSLLPLLV